MSWQDKKTPKIKKTGPEKMDDDDKRKTFWCVIDPNVFRFLVEYRKTQGIGSGGRLIDQLISDKFAIKLESKK